MTISTRRPPLWSVVVAEICLAGALLACYLAPGSWRILGALAGVVAAPTVIAYGARRSHPGHSLGFGRRRLRSRRLLSRSRRSRIIEPEYPLPIDVPADDDRVGVRWTGSTLVTVIRVTDTRPVPVALTVHPAPVASLPLAVLADCLEQFDIRLAGIDIVRVAGRDWSADRVGTACARTLGPLHAITHCAVHIVARLDPLRCPDAVARRGGASTGAVRAATIATRRVAARLAENGLTATILTAGDIMSLDAALTRGRPTDLSGPQTTVVDPANGAAAFGAVLERLWASTGPSITTTVGLRPTSDGAAIHALARFPAGSPGPAGMAPAGLLSVSDPAVDLLAAGLAVDIPSRISRAIPALRGASGQKLLHHTRIPVSAHGQLLGADDAGHAIAFPVVGPGGPRVVDLRVGPALMIQVAMRAVAAGAAITVHTSRPAIWEPLMRAVGDPRRLSPAPGHPHPPHAIPVHLYDNLPAPEVPHPDITTIRVTTVGDPGDDAIGTANPPVAAAIVQEADSGDMLVSSAAGTQRLTVVATPDEWHLIGRSAPRPREQPEKLSPLRR